MQRQETLRAQVLEAHRIATERQRQYDTALAEAVSTGGQLPDEPPAVAKGPDGALTMITAELMAFPERRSQVLAEIADEVEAGLKERVRVAIAEVANLAAPLEKARRSVLADLALARTVRQAADVAAGVIRRPSRADRTRHTLNADELVALALSGADPLAVAALPPGPGPGQVMRDDGRDQAVLIGRQRTVSGAPGYTAGGRFDEAERQQNLAATGRRPGEM